ncbi:MAG: hypothetical protein M3323_15670 [Actinomycetota bacterium]|nr:hypothetical protein [Actinomycetota bacterium]
MTKRSAPHLLRGAVSELIDSQRCPDVSAFDALAAEARALSESEAAAEAGDERLHAAS